MRRKFLLLVCICTFVLLVWWKVRPLALADEQRSPVRHGKAHAADTIQRLNNSRHLVVSAFKDHRRGGAIRVISILRRAELRKMYCLLCLQNTTSPKPGEGDFSQCASSQAAVEIHRDHFNFPYGTADILCTSPSSIKATHVAISMHPTPVQSLKYLPIQNQETKVSFKYRFTVCVSNLFGDFNNALQFVQTMEVYKLIGIQRVVIYNTSCGPDVEKVLKHYSQEGMLEVVPWPIDKFLTPSKGHHRGRTDGDVHYYGQTATLNECIYRYMYQSQYLLLNDIDEIIMPYEHASLGHLMDTLQKQYATAGVFRIENPIFPKTQFDSSGHFNRPEWKNVPGLNIFEHIYREPGRKGVYKPKKLIINPRFVEQTSIHQVLKHSGPSINVGFDVCRIIHVRIPLQANLYKDQLYEDKKLWEFEKKLIPNINRALHQSGLLLL
ncbi:uncharacterized protein LOC134468424 [Engraulis encrasicolus]|uniref:uncharacterized protein LOC134468424 n=1 Tax=Engraulis encrasicolus TaxID=184585 RepID=UPI002FD6F4F2